MTSQPLSALTMLLSRHTRSRREFITLVGGGAVAWPLAARAQQAGERVRRIGILTYLASDDADWQSRNAAFLQGLQELGWAVGRNVRIDYRWGASNFDPERMRKGAVELVALAPDVVLATTVPIVLALQQVSRTVPIVFAAAIDPVGAGPGRQPCAAGRQRHRLYYVRVRY